MNKAVHTHIRVNADLHCHGELVFTKGTALRIVSINKSGCAAADETGEIFIIRPTNYEIVENVH